VFVTSESRLGAGNASTLNPAVFTDLMLKPCQGPKHEQTRTVSGAVDRGTHLGGGDVRNIFVGKLLQDGGLPSIVKAQQEDACLRGRDTCLTAA
jgi:hypothetical protein